MRSKVTKQFSDKYKSQVPELVTLLFLHTSKMLNFTPKKLLFPFLINFLYIASFHQNTYAKTGKMFVGRVGESRATEECPSPFTANAPSPNPTQKLAKNRKILKLVNNTSHSKELLFAIKNSGKIRDANFSLYKSVTKFNDSKTRLLSIRPNNRIDIYSSDKREWLRSYPTDLYHLHRPGAFAVDRDNKYLVTGGASNSSTPEGVGELKKIIIWEYGESPADTRKIKPRFTICNVPGRVTDLSFSRDGKSLIAALGVDRGKGENPNPNLTIFKIDQLLKQRRASASYTQLTGNEATKIPAHDNAIESIQVSPDGRFLATSGTEGKLRLWNTSNWTRHITLELGSKGAANQLKFSSVNGSEHVFAALPSGSLTSWNISDGKFSSDSMKVFDSSGALSFDINNTGQKIVVGSNQSQLKIIDWPNKKDLSSMDLQSPEGGVLYSAVWFDPTKENSIISSNSLGVISIWDTTVENVIKPPSCKRNLDGFKVAIGLILLIVAIAVFILIFALRNTLLSLVKGIDKTRDNFIDQGESLKTPLDNSIQVLNSTEEDVQKISEIIESMKIDQVLLDYVDETEYQDVEVNIQEIVSRTENISKNFGALEVASKSFSQNIDKLLNTMEEFPTRKATENIIDKLTALLILLNLALLLPGFWLIYTAGNQGEAVCQPETTAKKIEYIQSNDEQSI